MINFTDKVKDSATMTDYFYARGKIISISTDSITLRTEREERNTFWNDGFKYGSYEAFGDCRDEFRDYAISDIGSLQFTNPARKTFRVIGGNLIALAVISAALIAPIVSIDFKNETFCGDRYKGWLIGSAITLGIGIPMTVLSKPKKVNLKDDTGYQYSRWEVIK